MTKKIERKHTVRWRCECRAATIFGSKRELKVSGVYRLGNHADMAQWLVCHECGDAYLLAPRVVFR